MECVGWIYPLPSNGFFYRKKKFLLRKPRINKGEEFADAALDEELRYLFLDVCLEDKEIYMNPCLVSFL